MNSKQKYILSTFFIGSFFSCGRSDDGKIDLSKPMYINVLSRQSVDSNNRSNVSAQFFAANPPATTGTTVMYSASYGIGGEAGQAWGKLQETPDGVFFNQMDNTTTQLLLPPGMPFQNSSSGPSLWEFKSYLKMLGDVAKAHFYDDKSSSEMYSNLQTSEVSFTAETAGQSAQYNDALELKLTKNNVGGSTSNFTVYMVKDVGPVAMEFSENGSTDGTFKLYIKR